MQQAETLQMNEIFEKISVSSVPYDDVPQLSKRDLTYITEDENLRQFYKYSPRIETFKEVFEDKSRENFDRDLLVQVLKAQYRNLDTDNSVGKNIDLIAESNTYTVITAHQPSLFTGPLYYILKIFSAINLAEQLNQKYPQYNVVPIFVTGGEDHDFEEVNHLNIFGKTVEWHSGETGSVGMMKTNKIPLSELKEILGTAERAEEIFRVFEKAYTSNSRYADGVIEMVHSLFAEYGLVVMDMNKPELKAKFADIIAEELTVRSSHQIVGKTIEKLEALGFNAQATPREINLFYLRDQLRSRIVFENDRYNVLDTDFSFSEEEIKEEVKNHPERFSPNVILRPLYQERVLPNLAYIGGGGEIAYWLERKSQFEHYGINFPMLIRRNSAMWADKASMKKIQKLDLSLSEIFKETDWLLKEYVKNNTEAEISLKEEKNTLNKVFQAIVEKSNTIDPALRKTIQAEQAKQMKSITNLESKLLRAEKNKHEVALNQIRGLKNKLFPGNGLQERKDNFLNFYTKHGSGFFQVLKEHLNPLHKNFMIFSENV